MSRRRQILDTIAERIKAATGLSNVTPWQSSSFRPESLPAIAWRDRVSRDASGTLGSSWHRLTVAYAGYSSISPAAIRELLLQTLGAIGSDITQGGLAINTSYSFSTLGLEVSGEKVCGFRLDINILYEIIAEDLSSSEGNRLIDENDNVLTDEDGDTLTW